MKVLVTGGAGFIGSYTVDMLIEKRYKVVVLDNLEPQVHSNKKPDYLNSEAEYIWGDVLGSGINLPFKGDSFDVVTAIDVLEHIPKNLRSLFVQELTRVARSYVIIAAPFKNSRIQQVEYELNNFYNKYSEDSPWLKEHIKYDLPDLESLKEKEEKVKVFNIMHLKRFQFIAELKTIVRKIPFSFIIEYLINLFYNFLFYRLDTSNPTNHYRKVILIKKCYVNILRARHC